MPLLMVCMLVRQNNVGYSGDMMYLHDAYALFG